MSAPSEFLVLRHRLSHPDESAYRTAKHLRLDDWTVLQVLKRLKPADLVIEDQVVEALRTSRRRPTWREFHFRVPNPANWYRSFEHPFLLSGELTAAEVDGYAIVPERHLVYVQSHDGPAATKAALDALGQVASREKANLTIRVADEWLSPDDRVPKAVERGQRLLDYAESRQLILLRGLQRVR